MFHGTELFAGGDGEEVGESGTVDVLVCLISCSWLHQLRAMMDTFSDNQMRIF